MAVRRRQKSTLKKVRGKGGRFQKKTCNTELQADRPSRTQQSSSESAEEQVQELQAREISPPETPPDVERVEAGPTAIIGPGGHGGPVSRYL
jgi:hypothetical protein